ncbi:MAG: hypothetical protein QM740_13355 [Acidovorax sp.]
MGIFEPISAELAQRLVEDCPHPEAPRKAVVEFVAQHDGQIYLFVNDALLPWPIEDGPWPFYKNNTGGGRLTIADITEHAPPAASDIACTPATRNRSSP